MNDRSVFVRAINVSRETLSDLERYAELLRKWNRAINLVSPATLNVLWCRHFLDSAQIFRLAPASVRLWADLGSGAGFPGLVVACLAKRERPDMAVVCVESDRRKAEFLRHVVRDLDLPARILPERAETTPPLGADIVSARALAALPALLPLAWRHLAPGGRAVFPKGAGYRQEIRRVGSEWVFDIEIEPSKTEESGAILILGGVRRA